MNTVVPKTLQFDLLQIPKRESHFQGKSPKRSEKRMPCAIAFLKSSSIPSSSIGRFPSCNERILFELQSVPMTGTPWDANIMAVGSPIYPIPMTLTVFYLFSSGVTNQYKRFLDVVLYRKSPTNGKKTITHNDSFNRCVLWSLNMCLLYKSG